MILDGPQNIESSKKTVRKIPTEVLMGSNLFKNSLVAIPSLHSGSIII